VDYYTLPVILIILNYTHGMSLVNSA